MSPMQVRLGKGRRMWRSLNGSTSIVIEIMTISPQLNYLLIVEL